MGNSLQIYELVIESTQMGSSPSAERRLKRWLSGYEYLMLSQRPGVQFPAFLSGDCNSSSVGSGALFQPPQASVHV